MFSVMAGHHCDKLLIDFSGEATIFLSLSHELCLTVVLETRSVAEAEKEVRDPKCEQTGDLAA